MSGSGVLALVQAVAILVILACWIGHSILDDQIEELERRCRGGE